MLRFLARFLPHIPALIQPAPWMVNGMSAIVLVGGLIAVLMMDVSVTSSDQVGEIQFVSVSGGNFSMGSSSGEGDETVHPVVVGDFEIGKYEVTQAQWRAVMGSDPPELRFKRCDACPVEGVSWIDARDFIAKLNARQDGHTYGLPTEAQWEYACRSGGKAETYCGGEDVNAVANMNISKTYPVGGYNENGLGIYDMSGNVYEWTCSEYQNPYNGSENTCNNDANNSASRVVRGGSWDDRAGWLRSANRITSAPGNRYSVIGFRLLRTP